MIAVISHADKIRLDVRGMQINLSKAEATQVVAFLNSTLKSMHSETDWAKKKVESLYLEVATTNRSNQ